jgi:hypothetical protein
VIYFCTDTVFLLLQELLTRSFGYLPLRLNENEFVLANVKPDIINDSRYLPIWNLCKNLVLLRKFLTSRDKEKYFHCEWTETEAFLFFTGRPKYYVTSRSGERPTAPAKYHRAADKLWCYIYYTFVHPRKDPVLIIRDQHPQTLFEQLRDDMKAHKWVLTTNKCGKYDDEDKATTLILDTIKTYPARQRNFKARLYRFMKDLSHDTRPLRTLKFSYSRTTIQQTCDRGATRDQAGGSQQSDQGGPSSASQIALATADFEVNVAGDIPAYVQALDLSEGNKLLLESFLSNRPHFGALRSEVAKLLASAAHKSHLKAFDDVLCSCLMLQTTPGEIGAFHASIQLFAMKYATFNKTAKGLMTTYGFTLESLHLLMTARSSAIETLGATDAWHNAINRYGWMLGCDIDILSPRMQHHIGRQADCQLLHWILKANHIPAFTLDTRGDGNCFLYSTYGAIIAAIGQPPGNINNETFAKALRWLVIVHAHQFCVDSVIDNLYDQLINSAHIDPNDSSAVDNTFCEPHAFMPRMCLLFQMNMRVLRATRKRDADGSEKWHLDCLQYTFRSEYWNHWVRTKSFARKIPFLEWDLLEDADAIRDFNEMGGVYAFMHHSIVAFDGNTLSRGWAGQEERQTAAISDVVPMLLGQSDPNADTADQLIIAMVSCDKIGHYCCLRGEDVQSLHPTKHEQMRTLVNKLKQTWTQYNDEAKRIKSELVKSERQLQKKIAQDKKTEEKRMAADAKKTSKHPSEEPTLLSQGGLETEAVQALSRMGLDDCSNLSINEKERPEDIDVDSEAIPRM